MLSDLNIEALFFFSVDAYILAFYFKNFSKLIEDKGWIVFIFIHIPLFYGVLVFSTTLEMHNDTVVTWVFLLVFLLRFFKKDV